MSDPASTPRIAWSRTNGPFVEDGPTCEAIVTLAMALKCYPLQPGGLLAIEAVALGMTTPRDVYHETTANFSVILLLMFMVAGIYFMRELLLVIVHEAARRRALEALLLDRVHDRRGRALGVPRRPHGHRRRHRRRDRPVRGVPPLRVGTRASTTTTTTTTTSSSTIPLRGDLERSALPAEPDDARAVGTAMGGLATLVGEPQNLLIGEPPDGTSASSSCDAAELDARRSCVGLATAALLERTRWFGYGAAAAGIGSRGHGALGQGAIAQRTPRDARA